MATIPPPSKNLGDNRGPEITQSITVVVVLTALSLIGRLFSRRLQKVPLAASDYTIILGWLTACGMTIIIYIGVTLGLGKHIEVVPLEDMTKILKSTMASEILYSITISATKISILLFYREIFPGPRFAIATNIVAAFVIAWGVACILVAIFSCNPVNGFWDLTIPSKCIETRMFFIGNSVPNIIMDVVILTLPMNKIWHLQMQFKQKLIVSGLFLLGGFVCISSGIRLLFLQDMDVRNLTWSYVGTAFWSVVEVNVAVMSACFPTMRPLLQRTIPKLLSIGSFSFGSQKKGGGLVPCENTHAFRSKDITVPQRVPGPSQGHVTIPKPAEVQYVNIIQRETA
ncbi:hypothetical protein EPUS_09033 [Endocarpon pusillum Z07020]|uniref:Rhodopsin domain-containing protein n=1 Tax=Endocarpon pusillum (strain Z07020 / HMAS-L-300199) TaxID=1263415 RepID=U1GKU7_ENDPU|nr:uncharacterized protein EPUS_09033 [Endocarpon pusillum Z07020]ERF72506.1 hypothetical protein EPUS_09033 [Endocarpon pusillum Z07020]